MHTKDAVSPDRLTNAVNAQVIRKEFYESIAAWTKARQAGKTDTQRQTILRHLIRTVFAWILKEDGIIPAEPFEEQFAARYGNGNYHDSILAFLFHGRLNTPVAQRAAHPTPEVGCGAG